MGILTALYYLGSIVISRRSQLRSLDAERRIMTIAGFSFLTLILLRFSAPEIDNAILDGKSLPFYIDIILGIAVALGGLSIGLIWSAVFDDTKTKLGRVTTALLFFISAILSIGAAEYLPIIALPIALRTGWARKVAETRRPRAILIGLIGLAAALLWRIPATVGEGSFLGGDPSHSSIFHFIRAIICAQTGVLSLRFLLGLIFGPRRIGRRLLVSHMLAGLIPVAFTALFLIIITLLTIANFRATMADHLLNLKHRCSQELFRQNTARIAAPNEFWRSLPSWETTIDTTSTELPDDLLTHSSDWAKEIATRIPSFTFWERTPESDQCGLSRYVLSVGLQWNNSADSLSASSYSFLASLKFFSGDEDDIYDVEELRADLITPERNLSSHVGTTTWLDSIPPPSGWLSRARESEDYGLIKCRGRSFHIVDLRTLVDDILVRIHLIETLPQGRVTALTQELGERVWIDESRVYADASHPVHDAGVITSPAASANHTEVNAWKSIRRQVTGQQWVPEAAQWARVQIPVLGLAGLNDMMPPSPSVQDPFSYVSIILLIILLFLFIVALLFAFFSAVRMGSAIAQSVGILRIGTEHMQTGDFSHRIVVQGEDELATLGEAFNDMAMNLEGAQKMALEKERLESELALARRIQQRLLPSEPPETPGLNLAGLSLPARQVGGDYYDFLPRPSGNLVFVMADVSGKGAPAALLMSSLRASIHSMLPAHETLDDLVIQLNQIIYACTDISEFITCFIGIISPATGELHYVNAGHEQPYVLHNHGLTSRLDKGGLMLGAFPSAPYESGTIILEPGELLFLFTDGLTEANDPKGNMFGEPRLDQLLQSHLNASPGDLLDTALSSVESFVDGAEASDDITLLSIRRTHSV